MLQYMVGACDPRYHDPNRVLRTLPVQTPAHEYGAVAASAPPWNPRVVPEHKLRRALPLNPKFVRLTKEWVDECVDPNLQRYLTKPPPGGYGTLYAYIKYGGGHCRSYGGQTQQPFHDRHAQHRDAWKRKDGKPVTWFDQELHKVGEQWFHKVILALLPIAELNDAEVALIAQFRLCTTCKTWGYNLDPGGKSSSPTAETRAKISATMLEPEKNAELRRIRQEEAKRQEAADPGARKRRAEEAMAAMPADKVATMRANITAALRTPEFRALKSTQAQEQAEREEAADPGGRKRRVEEAMAAMPAEKMATMKANSTAAHRTPEYRALKSTHAQEQAKREEAADPGGRKRRGEKQMAAVHLGTYWYANTYHEPFEPSKKKRKAMRAAHNAVQEVPLYMLGKDGETLFRVETDGNLINRDAIGKRHVWNDDEGYATDESVSLRRSSLRRSPPPYSRSLSSLP